MNTIDSEQEVANAVNLDWYSEEDVVRVTPRDQLRFDVHKDQAIQILRLAKQGELFQSQLSLLNQQLAKWLREHGAKIEKAYLTLRDARFAFLAISNSPLCDDELEDAVTCLDFDIANDASLNLIRLNAMVLPSASQEALGSFIDDRFCLVFRGLSQ